MAAVYAVNEDSLQGGNEGLSSEKMSLGPKLVISPLIIKPKKIKVEDTSTDEAHGCNDPVASRHHAADAVVHTAPPVEIKEERNDDEEYFQIKLGDVGGSSDERAENNESDQDDESAAGDWLFRCVDCGEAFGQREAYLEHRSEHTHDGPIVCLDSDSQWNDLLVSEDGGHRTLCCALCGRKFSSSRGFFAHQIKHRGETIKQEPGPDVGVSARKQHVFECKDCGKTYSALGYYLNHQRSHKQASKSVFHQLAQLKKKSFQCSTCGRCYSRASALDAHRRCHEVKLFKSRSSGIEKAPAQREHEEENGDKAGYYKKSVPLHKCSDCGKAFRSLSGLRKHQRFRSNCKGEFKRSFHCPQCDKSFLTSNALAGHQQWHIRRTNNSGMSLTCKECEKVFSSLTFYQRHQRVAHSAPAKSFLHQDETEQVKTNTYSCPHCGKLFSRAMALQFHMKSHGYETGYPGYSCLSKSVPKVEAFKSDARNSENKGADDGPFHCNQCGKGFFQYCVLRRHQRHHSGNETEADPESPPDGTQESKDKPSTSKLACPKCDETFSRASLLASHRHSRHGEAALCSQRNVAFLSTEKHQSQLHSGLEPPDVPEPVKSRSVVQKTKYFKCPDCGKHFFKIRGLRAHVWKVHHASEKTIGTYKSSSKPFPCTGCEKRYSSQGALYNHRKICVVAKKKLKIPKTLKDPLPTPRLSEHIRKCLFKCHKCGKAFPSVDRLAAHSDVAKSRPHCCALCCRGYWTEAQLQQHLVWHDEVRRRLPADLRYRLSAFASTAAASTNQHDARPPPTALAPTPPPGSYLPNRHKCLRCGDAFQTALALKQHQTLRSGRAQYKCTLCLQVFGRPQDLGDHRQKCPDDRRPRSDAEKDPPPTESSRENVDLKCIELKLRIMRCQDCGEQFSRLQAFRIHKLQHRVNKEEKKGRKIFLNHGWKKSKTSLVNTKKDKKAEGTSSNAAKITWNFSSAEARASEIFEVRPQVAVLPEQQKSTCSSSNKVYACAVCGKVYSYLESFRNHQKLHQNKEDKPEAFPCLDCGKVFYNASNFVSHIKMHKTTGGSYNFRCDQCNKNFNSYQTWMAHREIHRRKPFWCLSCARGFRDAEGLDRHLIGHDLKRHKCDICSKTFRVPAELRYHYNTHTGAKPYTCGLCKRKFSQLGNLITHRKKHVGVYKEGSETPLGSRNKQFAGKRRVTVMKKLVVMAMGEVQEDMGADLKVPADNLGKEESETEEMASGGDEEGERPKDAEEEGDLECFECGTLFRQESDLHQHYMKHASGEL
ncbi:zinc finger protein 729-like isoform X1 [Arapaima gigas]